MSTTTIYFKNQPNFSSLDSSYYMLEKLPNRNSKDFLEVYDDGSLRVEHGNFFVTWKGKPIKLPRAEFLIFSRLAQTPERVVSSLDLWIQAWGRRKDFNPVSLHVYMYRLRRKFEPLGIRIETMVNVGYRLLPEESAEIGE